MKKALSLILLVAMVATMSVAVFADFDMSARVENGEVTFTFPKANTALALDGVITDGEFYKVEVTADDMSYASNGDFADAAAMKWDAYAAWDDTGIRTAVVYQIGTGDFGAFWNERDGDEGNIWNATAIQVSLSNQGRDAVGYLELGYALSSATGADLTVVWTNSSEGNTDYEATAGTDFKVTKVGDTLVYETMVPWTVFSPAALAEGANMGWCLVIAGGSDNYGHCHAQIAAGCTGDPGKNSDMFAVVTLGAAPEIVTEPEVVEEAPAPDVAAPDAGVEAPAPVAPPTADVTVIMTLVAAASAFGGAVVFKKKR